MSAEPLLEYWPEGILAARIPANNNVRLIQTLLLNPAISATEDTQPGSPAEGDVYILPASPTGSQWSLFFENDVVIFYNNTWTAYTPPEGLRKFVEDQGQDWQFIGDSSGGWGPAGGGGGSASWGTITGTLSSQSDLQSALDAKAQDRRTVSAVTPASGVATINCGLGDYFTLAPTANVTSIVFSNLPGSGKGASLMIRFTQDTSARTVAWPASFKWAGGTPGAVSTGSGAVDVIAITTFDNGTTWDATIAKAFA